jgi:hypothetical protein
VLSFVNDIARGGLRVATQGHHQGGFSGTIGTDQSDNFTAINLNRDIMQCLNFAVKSAYIIHH